MSNSKITDLDLVTTPLAHTEEIEVVQGGENKRTPISNIARNLQLVEFNTAPIVPAHQEGRIYWDADAATLAYMTDVPGVVFQVGQEQYVKGRNNSGAEIANGKPVYMTGAIGNRPTIALAQANMLQGSRLLGLATESIADNADGYVTAFGLVRDIDTSAFITNDTLFVSETVAGDLVNVAPATYPAIAGTCVISHATQGIVLVRTVIFN